MKYTISVLLAIITIILVLVGCQTTPQPTISVRTEDKPLQVDRGDEFNIYLTVDNPTSSIFTPYIALDYPDTIQPTDPDLRQRGEKIELSSIKKLGNKGYSIKFNVNDRAQEGIYSIKIGIYNRSDSLSPLKEPILYEVEVVERVTGSD